MKQHEVTVPQIGLIAGTRAMLGAGIALLRRTSTYTQIRRVPDCAIFAADHIYSSKGGKAEWPCS